jgi:hypothetical protein
MYVNVTFRVEVEAVAELFYVCTGLIKFLILVVCMIDIDKSYMILWHIS